MKIGFIQNSPIFGNKSKNFDKINEMIGNIKADLLVLPELFATGYTFISREEAINLAEDKKDITAEFLKNISKKTGAIIVAGFIEKNEDKIYNSSLIVYKNEVVDTYRKIHLFNKEKLWFSSGDKPFNVIDINGTKIGVMICFDWIFPEAARSLALLGAEIIAHPTNLVLPYCQDAMVTRCLENRVFAVTANRIGREIRGDDDFTFTGESQITDNTGKRLAKAPINEECIEIVDINHIDARNKNLNPYNDLFNDRNSDLYKL